MSSLLDLLADCEVRRLNTGETLIQEGERTGYLYFLIEGAVEVRKDNALLFASSQPGTVFGELSTLLGGNHLSTVTAVKPSAFYIVENPRTFLATGAVDDEVLGFHVMKPTSHRFSGGIAAVKIVVA